MHNIVQMTLGYPLTLEYPLPLKYPLTLEYPLPLEYPLTLARLINLSCLVTLSRWQVLLCLWLCWYLQLSALLFWFSGGGKHS